MQQAVEYYNNKLYSQAISTATKELVLRKNDFHLLHLRANCYTALREYKKALVDLKVLIINYPTEHRAYFKAVKCFRLLKDYRNLEKIVNAGIQKVKDVEKIKELKLVKITTKEKTRGKELILPVELMTFVFW
jgi:tetratricopeptide (TPR) repeat protein